MKPRAIALAVSSLCMLAASQVAMADSTDDLLKKLHDKGILNDQEYNEFNTSRDSENEQKAKEKSVLNKGKVKLGKFIDNATIYGDVRVRYEHRDGEDLQAVKANEDRDRGRYKITLGVKTEAENFFYTDLALAMGNRGRSDNATFGAGSIPSVAGTGSAGSDNKEIVYVKRALVGWHGIDWLTIEAGRVANPLYTTEMVWDRDLNLEGLVEKLEYSVNGVDLFGNFAQSFYSADAVNFSAGATNDTPSAALFAFQGGAKYKFTDEVSAKAAFTYTTYTHGDNASGTAGTKFFTPGLGNAPVGGIGTNLLAINDIRTIEIPFEVSYKALTNNYTFTGFGDFVHNLDGSDRCTHAGAAICALGNDDNAWMLGVGVKSAGKEAAPGDWEARIWWQDVGVYALDPNTPDSDFMDSRLNMKGVVIKASYNIESNVLLNVAAGHASRKNKAIAATTGAGNDLNLNVDDYNLYQVDLTYKF